MTSASSGHSSLRANPPVMPWAPSSRCTVVAGWSVSSSSRLAARPVGAASAMSVPLARSSLTTAATVRLLPVPGPPVSRLTPDSSTWATAACLRRVQPLGDGAHRRGVGDPLRGGGQPGDRLGHQLLGHAVAGQRQRPQRRIGLGVRDPRGSGRLVLEHVAGLDGGDDRGRRVADALGLQRGDDQVGRQHGVPVAGRRPQGEPDDRPAAAGVLPVGARRGRRSPAGRRRRGRPRCRREQRPRVVAQPAGGVRPEGVGDAGGQLGLQAGADQQLDDLVGRLGGQEAGEQPLGPLPADLRDLDQPVGGDVVGGDDAGAGQLGRRPPAQARPQPGGAEGGEDRVAARRGGGRASPVGPALGIAEGRRGDVLQRGADRRGQPDAVGVERGLQLLGGARADDRRDDARAGRAPRPARRPAGWCPGPRRR